jgi:hypothetical protein
MIHIWEIDFTGAHMEWLGSRWVRRSMWGIFKWRSALAFTDCFPRLIKIYIMCQDLYGVDLNCVSWNKCYWLSSVRNTPITHV